MNQFRTGVIGVGFIGAAHIEALRRLGNVQVVALCNDVDCASLAKRLYVQKAYDDYRRMIDECDLDFVHVCTPNQTHFAIASYALTHGVNVVCEKPLAVTVGEAKELCRLARENGRIHAVNFHSRCYPMVRQMKEMVAAGDLGRLLSVHGEYLQDWLLYQTDYSWRLETADGGASRAVADIGSHWLDTAEYVTGRRITRVLADFATFYPERFRPTGNAETFSGAASKGEPFRVQTEDYAQILMELEGGVKGSLVVSQMFAGRKNQMTLSVAGTRQALHLDTERLNELWIGRRDGFNRIAAKDPSLLSSGAREVDSYPGGHVEGFPDAFKHNFRQIYAAAQNGQYATFADGLREMVLCSAILTSACTQQWVEL